MTITTAPTSQMMLFIKGVFLLIGVIENARKSVSHRRD